MSDQEGPTPAYHDNPLLMLAFRDMVFWAAGEPEILEQFRADTGFPAPSSSVIGAMIDDASGLNDTFAEAFVSWCIANLWGEEGDDGR